MSDIIDTIRMQMLAARRDNEEWFFLMPPGRRDKWNLVGTLFGMSVFISPLCERTGPVREHKQAMRVDRHTFAVLPRDKGCYHKRIQKKWNKRFGTKVHQDIFVVGNSVIMSHVNFKQLALVGLAQ